MSRPALRSRRSARQAGVTAVEFAFVAMIYLALILAITDLGRWFFTANAASEATRLGARLAVVCSRSSWTGGVYDQMHVFVSDMTPSNVTFETFPSNSCVEYGSDPTTVCTGVSVTVSGLTLRPISPYLPEVPIPSFKVTLPRESMATSLPEATGGPSNNSVCS